ncbi:MAG TPA: 4-hydroxy-3-methylbut-2-enyl diphosphate reductase [Armatimonadota bacterium]|nr:4-hydroxy-3-methylbut-2-enyl diphosphate reductase [Armatimonadota bacterium]HOS43931.1 4-hydroxy-3-methylbut-2-enyl diphosphate reductase [Armatimonadota bacterium]
MQIILSDVLGFCFGVSRAIALAEEALAGGCAVCTLGSLVHNPQETARLAAAGVRQVETPEAVDGDAVVIRAHGARPETFDALRARRLRIIDATCPFVQKSQRIARRFNKQGMTLVIVGHENHPEVQSILGYFPGPAHVVASPDEVAALPGGITPGIIAQTTMPEETFQAVVDAIAARYPRFAACDTVCSATRERQEAARRLAAQVDAIYIVGGRHSSNTNRLAEICRRACPRTVLIETAEEITLADLSGVEKLGIAAGASTPAWLIQTVIDRLEALAGQAQQS